MICTTPIGRPWTSAIRTSWTASWWTTSSAQSTTSSSPVAAITCGCWSQCARRGTSATVAGRSITGAGLAGVEALERHVIAGAGHAPELEVVPTDVERGLGDDEARLPVVRGSVGADDGAVHRERDDRCCARVHRRTH